MCKCKTLGYTGLFSLHIELPSYISGYSAKAHCLYQLLRKGVKFVWKDEQKAAFDILKTSLLNSEALAFPQYDLPFYLEVDTSSQGIGYML